MPKVVKKKTSKSASKNGVNNAAPSKAKKKQEKSAGGKSLRYPKLETKVFPYERGLTYQEAKDLLGWVEECENDDFENDYLFVYEGKKIRTIKNKNNRPFMVSNAQVIKQQILRGNWRLNGEAMIIGNKGSVISAQHRLVGLIMAVDEWRKEPGKWPEWKKEPTLPTFINYGIEESDDVVNTVDTGKSRSLSDVIYRSACFPNASLNDNRKLSRITEFCIRTLWERTGAKDNAYGKDLFRTHDEAIDFLFRHVRILECVKQVYADQRKIKKLIKSLGTAAALMYLMGCCATDRSDYIAGEPPNENLLDWSKWKDAQKFWHDMGEGHERLKSMRLAISSLSEDSIAGINERIAVVIKTWVLMDNGQDPTPKDLSLHYTTDEEGEKLLDDYPIVGGIDIGKGGTGESVLIEDEEDGEDSVKEKVKRLRKENSRKTPGVEFTKGSNVWVYDEDGGHWKGTLTEDPKGTKALIKVAQGFSGAGQVFEVEYSKLTDKNPTTIR